MKFLEILLEGRRDDFLKSYGSKFDKNNLKTILSLSQDLNPNNKYLMFLGKVLQPGKIDVEKVKKIIDKFEKYQSSLNDREINNYDTLDAISQAISDHENRVRRDVKKVEGAEILYEDDRFVVVLPLTYETSCYYGSGTKWCTTSSESYFQKYNSEGKLFYVLDKKASSGDKYYKVAVQEGFDGSRTLWDVQDKPFYSGWILDTDNWKKIESTIVQYMETNYPDKIRIFKDEFLRKQERERIERENQRRERARKLAEAESRREDDEWNIENDTYMSNRANAVWRVINDDLNIDIAEGEDIYNLIPIGLGGRGIQVFEWIGENGYDEYQVGNDTEATEYATEMLKDQIQGNSLTEMYRHDFLESHLDTDKIEEFFQNLAEDLVREDIESYFDESEKELSSEQEKLIEELQEKIESLQEKIYQLRQKMDELEDDGSNEYQELEELVENTEEQITEAEEEIEEIKENPEGEVPEEKIEYQIENIKDEYVSNPMYYLDEFGVSLEDFIDIDSLIEDQLSTDGRGHILNYYDGTEYEASVNKHWYFVYIVN